MQAWRGLAVMGVGLVLGCAVTTVPVTAARPGWMENPQQKYPLKFYLSAVGEGDSLAAAEGVALGGLAKIFRSEVTVDERLAERYYELIGKQNFYQEQTQFDRDVTVRSAQHLLNVQYPEHYTDPKTGRVYALAILNRVETSGIYVTRLKQNDALITRFVTRAEAASPALRYAVLSAAVAVSAASQSLLEQLDVMLPAARNQVTLTYTHDQLTQRMGDAAKAIGFTVAIENDPQGKIAQSVVSLLTEQGFVMSADNAFLQVKGEVGLEHTDLGQQGLFFVRFTLKMEMTDADGKTVAALSEHGREGHVSEVEAANRCVRSMESLVGRELRRKLFVYFDGLAMQ